MVLVDVWEGVHLKRVRNDLERAGNVLKRKLARSIQVSHRGPALHKIGPRRDVSESCESAENLWTMISKV